MAEPSASDLNSLKASIDTLNASVKNMGGFQLPTISSVITGTTDSFIKLTSGTYGLNDALSLGKKAAEIFPVFGGVLGEVMEKVGSAGIAYNNVLKDLSKSGVNFNLDIGNMIDSVTGARLSLPEFQNLVKESGRSLSGLAGDANRSTAAFLGLAKDVAESDLGRELVATGISFEEMQKSLAITTAMRRGADLSSAEAQKEVVRSALEMTKEMDNVARLTGISRQEQEKAVQAQMRKTENEIMLMAMDQNQREAYQKSTAALGAYGKDFQDVLTAFKTGGIRTAEDTAKVAALGPEFTRLVKELSEIEGNDAEADRRREAIMAQMDRETLRLANDKEELKIRAALVTAGGEFGAAQGRVTLGLKDLATALQTLERRPGETIEAARKRVLDEAEAQRKAAAEGAGTAGQQTAALINRTEAMFKDISGGVGRAFKVGNDAVGEFAVKMRDTVNNVLVPLNTSYSAEFGQKIIDKIKGSTEGRGTNITNPTNPAIAGELESQARRPREPGREAFGSKEVWGDWFKGPRNRLTYLAEDEDEASVPRSKRGQFLFDTVKEDPSLLTPLIKDMQSTLSSATSASANSIKEFTDIMMQNFVQPNVPNFENSRSSASNTVGEIRPIDQSTEIQIEMVKGINNLNKLTAQLIEVVEMTGDKSAKAFKSRGNLLA